MDRLILTKYHTLQISFQRGQHQLIITADMFGGNPGHG